MPDFGEGGEGRSERERFDQFLRSAYEVMDEMVRTGRDGQGNEQWAPVVRLKSLGDDGALEEMKVKCQ